MFLTPNDFAVQNNEMVKPNDQGYSFVFFFTHECKRWCNEVKPSFDYMANMIQGVKFHYMDVAQNNWQLVNMLNLALGNDTPIKYVPLLILFANGNQIAQFFPDEDNPQNNIPKMQRFIIDNTRLHQQGASTRIQKNDGIPPYSIGIPGNLASRKVCQLFDTAYSKPQRNQ